MSRHLFSLFVASLLSQTAGAADSVDPCKGFAWDVSHELAVAKQTPSRITAASNTGQDVPRLALDKLYELELAAQTGVAFAITPGKPALGGARAGLVRFHTEKPGLYRVALTSGHWIDVVDGHEMITSKDFQRVHGCGRLHKIVEFVLPGTKNLTLQLSGSPEATVVLSVTPVAGSAPAP